MNKNIQNEIQTVSQKLRNLQLDYYHQYVFSWKWYLLVAGLIVPWLVVVFLLHNQRVKKTEYAFFTLWVVFLSSLLDQTGLSFGLFTYPIKIIPSFHTFLPGSIGLFPAVLLLLFHYFHTNLLRFFVGVLVFAGITSFIAQPLLVYWGIYEIKHWHYTASFAATVFIAAAARYLIHKFTTSSPPEQNNPARKIKKVEVNMRWLKKRAH